MTVHQYLTVNVWNAGYGFMAVLLRWRANLKDLHPSDKPARFARDNLTGLSISSGMWRRIPRRGTASAVSVAGSSVESSPFFHYIQATPDVHERESLIT